MAHNASNLSNASENVNDNDMGESQISDPGMGRCMKRRGIRPSVALNRPEFEVEFMPRCNLAMKSKLIRYVSKAGADLTDQSKRRRERKPSNLA